MKFALSAPLALALALCPAGLQAGDRVQFGGAVQVNLPFTDLKSDAHGRLGWGAAFQVAVDLGGGHLIRPRLSVDSYRLKGPLSLSGDRQDSVGLTGTGLGADYLYYLGGKKDGGLYLLGGLGAKRWSVDFSSYDRQGNTYSYSVTEAHRRTSLESALGLGYQVKSWFGVEARLTHSRYEGTEGVRLSDSTPTSPVADRDALAFQVGATFRW